MNIKIREMVEGDVEEVAKIASESFSGLKEKAEEWIKCNFSAFPRMKYFVAEDKEKICGYILWIEKGGFRKNAVIELEQIAVISESRGKGIGLKLINDSLKMIKKELHKRGSKLKIIEVTTGIENSAQKLYKKTLNAKVEATIKDLFRGDEVIMIARLKCVE